MVKRECSEPSILCNCRPAPFRQSARTAHPASLSRFTSCPSLNQFHQSGNSVPNTMDRRSTIAISVMTALGLALLPISAVGQQQSMKEQLVGTWSLVSFELVRQDGSKQSTFGANPKGIAFFDAGGHYSITVVRLDRAKYAINNFTEGTAEENKATAQGTMTYFGTYTVSEADRTIAIHIDGSSFPNWNGADQKRIFMIAGDELKLTSPAASGAGTAEVVWKRAK